MAASSALGAGSGARARMRRSEVRVPRSIASVPGAAGEVLIGIRTPGRLGVGGIWFEEPDGPPPTPGPERPVAGKSKGLDAIGVPGPGSGWKLVRRRP